MTGGVFRAVICGVFDLVDAIIYFARSRQVRRRPSSILFSDDGGRQRLKFASLVSCQRDHEQSFCVLRFACEPIAARVTTCDVTIS